MNRAHPPAPVRVLIVDDDPDFAAMTAAFLERQDDVFVTETATSVTEALDRFEADPGIDCVVSDYDMPGRTGLEFLDRLRADHPQIPFILFTGKGSEEIASRAISAGVTDYLQKRGDQEQFDRLANRIAHATSARRAEREAAEVDAQLRTIVESATDAILTIDESSTIQFANSAVETVFGYTPGEVEGERLTMLMPERFRDRHLEGLGRYLDAGERELDWTRTELPGLHRDGNEIPLSISFGEFVRDGDRFFTGVIRDVSEREARERQLERYETIVESLEDAVWMVDAAGELVLVNRHVADRLDLPRDDILGRHFTEILGSEQGVLEEEVDAFQAAVEAVLRGEREIVRREITLPRGGGAEVREVTVVPVASDGPIVGAAGIIRDISEVARLQSELEATLDRVTDAFFAVDDDWRFTYVNDQAEALLGQRREDLLGALIWDVFEEANDSRFLEQFRLAMDEQEPVAFEEHYPPLDTWFDVQAYPSETGLSVYFRDVTDRRRRADRLAGLNETMTEFLMADTRESLSEMAVEAAADRLDLPVTTIALLDDSSSLEETARTPDAAAMLDETSLFSKDGVAWDAFTDDEVIDLKIDEQAFLDPTLAGDELRVYPLGRHGVFVTVIDPDEGPQDDFIETVVGNLTGALDRATRQEQLREREALLAEQNEWLDRLNRINDVIRRIDRVLVGASSREEIERTVCEELVAEGPYRFAWIGEIDSATDRLEPRQYAGDEEGYLDEVAFGIGDGDGKGEHPSVTAALRREPVVVDDILVDPPLADWRRAALDRGFRSCMAVPLVYRDRAFGTLTVYADRPEAFDELAKGILGEFGATIGHALNSIESTRALVSDSVVELEFSIVPADFPLLEPIESIPDCEIDLESVSPTSEGTYRVFLTVSDGREEFFDGLDTSSVVDDWDLIVDRGDVAVVELLVSHGSVIAWLLDHGAVPRSLSVGEQSHLQVDLPGQTDVRGFVELFQDVYPGSELVAKRERERSPRSRTSFQSELDDRLTARQREILVTAYRSGYFRTPRERTGEEVASSIGISQPTFSDHLRAALRKLLGMLYDDETPGRPSAGR